MSLLELEMVVKHYRGAAEEVRAVDGVDLRLDAGEMVALLGPSGSGKTTLLLLIAALLAPEAGAIRFDGRPHSSLSESERGGFLLDQVGFVYQSPHLMAHVSALENAATKLLLAGAGMRAARAQARDWLGRVGLADREQTLVERLSGGERQRVAIARALTGSPRLILADEPTGNLDSARSREIVGLLRSVAHEQGAAVLLVTHDHEAAALADRRLLLRDGQLCDHDAGPDAATATQNGPARADRPGVGPARALADATTER